ncbi:MAG: hypothetical protein U1F52_22410 [Burkholderiales bacterium]
MITVAIESRADLDRLVASGGAILIEVVAPGDPESDAAAAVCDQALSRCPGVTRARMDFGTAGALARLFGVAAAPALILFRAGVGLYAGPASFGPAQLEALLRRGLALDMDEVRRDLDRERARSTPAGDHRACPMSRHGEFPQSPTGDSI